ncbi:hypothetical protein BUALT_Bualt01G0109700 [Buddleja alternifolia]|uniref:RING-type E3 ubiquitin transferase n=1 Tax=Buddleja alternifolia TaxID=168488 RepID=A0AAV6Y736_9LAMI|nr:hypothetical protein BUALT_Bualt01G0109700 [Buddleja alternifolia]
MAKKAENVLLLQEAKAARELKKELQRVVGAFVDDDDGNLDGADYAIQTLSALKDLKLMKKSDQEFEEPPQELRCPISGLLMKDPVVLASGQTYDEPYIQKWLSEGHQTCPQTHQLLPHSLLIPNHSIKKMIAKWCKLHEVDIPRTTVNSDDEYYAANANRERLEQLLRQLSSSVSDQSEAAKELRILTNRFPCFRALFGEINDAISRLFDPILLEKAYSDPRLHLDLIATVLSISIHDNNKIKSLSAGPFLVDSLRHESIEIRSHAAAAMSSLSGHDSNKRIIVELGAIRPLIDIIEEGHPLAIKDAVLAILSLCTVIENRERAVSEGLISAVMNKIIDRVLIDEMLEILAMLSGHQRAIEEMEEYGILFCLFAILREDHNGKTKENSIAIIYSMCFFNRRNLRRINEVENAYETLSCIARSGTSRAKRKAIGILGRMNRFAFISNTA